MAQLPDWSPLAAVAPPASEGEGRVVGLVATEGGTSQGWAAGAAVDLARSWSGAGHRVILVDAALQAPSLHASLGLQDREGLSDAVLYGASVNRVSRAVDDGGFFVITAGTPVADPASVAKSARWHRLAEGMTEAGVLVLLYLRAVDAEASAFLGSASDIVILGGAGDPAPPSLEDLLPLVRAVTGKASGPSARVASQVAAKAARPAPSVEASTDSAKGGGSARPSRPLVTPVVGDEGMGKVILLLIATLLAAVGLGYLLTTVL